MYELPLRSALSPWRHVRHLPRCRYRVFSTLPGNQHVFLATYPAYPGRQYLSLLPTARANPELALGSCTAERVDPSTFQENPHLQRHLHDCLRRHAHEDPSVASQAAAFASQGGAGLGAPGRGAGAGGASDQGGTGGAGSTGYVHVSDLRAPPPFGRIPDPQDIFGSLEVDASGRFVDGHGNYEESGTYRMWTNDGCLGLTPFLREKLVAMLTELQSRSDSQSKP